MARFALIKPDNSVDRLASNIDPTVQTKAGWKWLPCDPVAPPSYDSLTEAVDGPAYNVGLTAVTEVWTKRSKTALELDADKDAAVASMNGGLMPVLKVLLNHENRIRALEAKAPVTMLQFKAALKALL